MFCPQCGSTQSDELKFCKTCGANLQALRQIMATRDSDDKFDWNKTWLAEMLMSGEEAVKHQDKIERLQGKTPEIKRRNEIKAGIITGSVGLALMLALSVLMEGIIISGRVSDIAAEILSRVWIVGVIPLLVGIALIINGVFVSKKGEVRTAFAPNENKPAEPEFLPPTKTNQLTSAVPFSVTDQTTRNLEEPILLRQKARPKN